MAVKRAAFAIIAIVLYAQGHLATPILPSATANTLDNNDLFENGTTSLPALDNDQLKNKLLLETQGNSTPSVPSTATNTTEIADVAETGTISSPPLDIDKEIKNIAKTCFTEDDMNHIIGRAFKPSVMVAAVWFFLDYSVSMIGLQEMRAELGYPPRGPWIKYSWPTEEEIAAASTIEEYYMLQEPFGKQFSLDSPWFYENNIVHTVEYLDNRFPAIRTIFRQMLADFHRRNVTVDRKFIDGMIEEYYKMRAKISRDGTKKHFDIMYECDRAL